MAGIYNLLPNAYCLMPKKLYLCTLKYKRL